MDEVARRPPERKATTEKTGGGIVSHVSGGGPVDRQRTLSVLACSIVLLALALRIAVALAAGVPAPEMLIYDEANYHEAAERLIVRGYFAYGSGPIGESPNAYTVPGYILFLTAIYAVRGYGAEGIQTVWLIQAMIGSATVWLVFVIGRRVGGQSLGSWRRS
jgi:hypothetical protein